MDPGSAQQLVAALLALHARGIPISQRGLAEAGETELLKAVHQIGGFWRARRLAGLPPPKARR